MADWMNLFNANANPNDPTSSAQLALRQRMALAMMEKKRAYPKTFGEGLAAIGESLGEIGMARQLAAQQAAIDRAQQQEKAANTQTSAAEPQAKVAETEPPAEQPKVADASVFPDPSTAQASIPQSMVAQLSPAPASPAAIAQATPVRDRVANLLLGGSAALDDPEVSQANPTQSGATPPTNLPYQVASLGGPPEAAGNRPIQSDVKPISQVMQVAQQYRPPPLAPRQPTDTPITMPEPPTSAPLPAQTPGVFNPQAEPARPGPVQKSPRQVEFEQKALTHPFVEMREFYKGQAALMEAERAKREALINKEYESRRNQYNQDVLETKRAQQNLPLTQQQLIEQKYKVQQQKEADERRAVYGDLPPHVHDYLTKGKEKTQLAINSLEGLRNAKEVVNAGTLFGIDAPAKLLYYRARAAAGDNDAARIVANTQTYRTALGPTAAQAIRSYGGAQISNTDREEGYKMSGADYTLDEKSARRMLDIAERSAIHQINEHRGDLDNLLKTQPPTLRRLYDVADPLGGMPAEQPAAPRVFSTMEEAERANLPRGSKIIVNGKRMKVQ